MQHHFQFNPRGILGVGPDASADEIRDAFREKSKKHHPDLGGDEWAFRMVLRAYEVLKSTANGLDGGAVEVGAGMPAGAATEPASSWSWPGPMGGPGGQRWFPFGAEAGGSTTATQAEPEADSTSEPSQTTPPNEFRTVDVELIWIRFEMPEKAVRDAAASESEPEGVDRATLSVCMVVSWPVKSLVARTAEFAGAGDTLRQVIEAFDRLDQGSALAVRTRIEDGQFVGWVSHRDVVAAQSAFLSFRDILTNEGLSVRLQTRDEMIPQNWLV